MINKIIDLKILLVIFVKKKYIKEKLFYLLSLMID